MTPKRASRGLGSRDQWAAQIAALDDPPRKEPITVGRIVHAALQLVETDGYDALTMRRVAGVLQASPGALYAHVRDKAELDDLMIAELCSRVTLPAPDPTQWMAQIMDVCAQLRDQYLRYPGISRATMTAAPLSLDALRINEGLLAILLAAGASAQPAAWATDAAFLYIAAYSVVALRRHAGDADGQDDDKAEWIERFRMLPADRFPIIRAHPAELMSGEGHERFDATLGRLFSGLVPQPGDHPQLKAIPDSTIVNKEQR